MDERSFDRWMLSLAKRLSRRELSQRGAGLLGTLGLALAAAAEAEAKKGKKK